MNLSVFSQFSLAEYPALIGAWITSKISPASLPPEGDRNLVACDLFGHALASGWQLERDGNINHLRFNEVGTELKVQVRRGTTDSNVFSQVFRNLEYGPVVSLYKQKFGNIASHIVDAGSNAGFASLYFAAHFPEAKIVALEIEKGNYVTMTTNFNANPKLNIVPLLRGLWYNEDELNVNSSFRSGGEYAFTIMPNSDLEKDLNQLVRGMTVSQIVQQHFGGQMIDILKIDIEGAEKYLFQDEELALEFLAQTKVMALEIHDDVADRTFIQSILVKAGMAWEDDKETTVAWHK